MFNTNKKPDYIGNNKIIFLKQGLNVKIKGAAAKTYFENIVIENYAVQPQNFKGVVPIPALSVNIGDKVKAGRYSVL